MSAKYQRLYSTTPNALGAPFPEITDFFECHRGPALDVLDIGCGQGRDALVIARLGHRVTGIDSAPAGIAALETAARAENLPVRAITADITTWRPEGEFDVVLVDRTLHMLGPADRLKVLERLLTCLRPGGTLLIADERRNLPALRDCILGSGRAAEVLKDAKGFLFVRVLATMKEHA